MQLKDWLAENPVTQRQFAGRIGVSDSAMSRYLSGDRIPKPAIITRIFQATGGQVTANDWFAPALPQPIGE